MIHVALLSKWHVHAEDYARQAVENEHLSIQRVWDEDPERGKQWADQLGVPFEQDLQAVLSDSSIDAVIVNTPTSRHKEIIVEAAKHKKHIFSEKVLALSLQDCEDIFRAVDAAHVQLMVSLPRLTESYYLYAQNVVDNGWLGTLTMIRCRLAHNGAVAYEGNPHGWLPPHFFNRDECGGGALIDLGAHPIYLTNRLAGPAQSVYAHLQPMRKLGVEDNAVVLVEYASGALGTIETGFLSSGSPFQLELYGTEGTLLIEDTHIRMKSARLKADQWITPEEMPQALPMPMEQWVRGMIDGTTSTITRKDMAHLTLMNEAAYLSHREGRRVQLREIEGRLL